MEATSPVRLNEFDKEEWWEIAREVRPAYTREEFERDWVEFLEMKKQKALS